MNPRSMSARFRRISWIPLWFVACACISRPDPVQVRYLDPSPAVPAVPSGGSDAAASRGVTLHFERVGSATHLQEPVVWRSEGQECGFYQDVLWVERPAHVLQRALERELFERRGFVRSEGRAQVHCAVDVFAFDEIVAPQRQAWVAVVMRFGPGDATLEQRTIEARVPVTDGEPRTLALAMSAASAQVVSEIGTVLAAPSEPATSAGHAGP